MFDGVTNMGMTRISQVMYQRK